MEQERTREITSKFAQTSVSTGESSNGFLHFVRVGSLIKKKRHCDPSTKEQAKSPSLPGYQIYTRSKTGTNAVRRVSGGYSAGNNGPCSKANKGKDINFFHDEKNMVSLEEFPMAFMLEGGLHDIGGSKIGQTSLLVDVKRSVTFRCIPHKENICKLEVYEMKTDVLI